MFVRVSGSALSGKKTPSCQAGLSFEGRSACRGNGGGEK